MFPGRSDLWVFLQVIQ